MTLLEKIRIVTRELQQTIGRPMPINRTLQTLKELADAEVIISNQGKALYSTIENPEEILASLLEETSEPQQKPTYNLPLNESGMLYSLVPVALGKNRIGSLILTHGYPLEDETKVLIEFIATVMEREIYRIEHQKVLLEEKGQAAATLALSSLSFTETEALKSIMQELPDGQGLIVSSRIADRHGFTRSVIISALRKLQSAGIIESQSLGVKGTYIKILNDKLYSVLQGQSEQPASSSFI